MKTKLLKSITISDLNSLEQFARDMLSFFKKGDIIVLSGDLGAGKTTFIRFFCKYLGIKEDVTSPTFTIINEYVSSVQTIYHFDFYRLRDIAELKGLNLDDYLFDDGICFMEWGEKVESVLPLPHYHLNIHIINDHSRKLELKIHDE
jgi:tRNA threonylcarbamoyladenosine biosynthesis protein TsaE